MSNLWFERCPVPAYLVSILLSSSLKEGRDGKKWVIIVIPNNISSSIINVTSDYQHMHNSPTLLVPKIQHKKCKLLLHIIAIPIYTAATRGASF
jgi:membrane glycosyltransferase